MLLPQQLDFHQKLFRVDQVEKHPPTDYQLCTLQSGIQIKASLVLDSHLTHVGMTPYFYKTLHEVFQKIMPQRFVFNFFLIGNKGMDVGIHMIHNRLKLGERHQ